MSKTVVIACDHAGFELKAAVVQAAEGMGWVILDVGTCSTASADFPDFAQLGAEKILRGEADLGIFMCGSGVGVSLAASKIPGIYACVCHDTYSAHQGVEHDGMNVLCLGSRVVGSELAKELVRAFLNAKFNNAPNQVRRLNKIKQIEAGDMYLSDRIKNLESAGQSLYQRFLRHRDIDFATLDQQVADNRLSGIVLDRHVLCGTAACRRVLNNRVVPLRMSQWGMTRMYHNTAASLCRKVAQALKPIYSETNGQDGYLVVQPVFESFTAEYKIAEDIRAFWKLVNRPNLCIALPVGVLSPSVFGELLSEGINLVFNAVTSESRVREISETYLTALQSRTDEGKTMDTLACMIAVEADILDNALEAEKLNAFFPILASQLAASVDRFNKSEYMTKRIEAGAKPLRILWLTESAEGIRYQNQLIARNTISAMTAAQIEEFRKDGRLNAMSMPSAATAEISEETRNRIQNISQQLEEAKVQMMIQAYETMQKGIEAAASSVEKGLGVLTAAIEANFKKLEEESMIARMFAKDPTVWTFDTADYTEIRNRLGWLDIYQTIEKTGPEYKAILEQLKAEGIKKVLLIGMGGSSLAPEVLALVFPEAEGLKLEIIDSTDPGQVLQADADHPLAETVYIVASKSGGTAEIRAMMDYFYAKAKASLGDNAGKHFIAITDPGTLLERTAKELKFRNIIISDPSIGGRFSVLSPFGIVPAALIGLDTAKITAKVTEIATICAPSAPMGANEGAALGVYLATAAQNGRDKITILTDREFNSFGSWLEQLIAESSGKLGRGIVPIDIEPELAPNGYAKDRAFVYVNFNGEKQPFVDALIEAGQPVLTIKLTDRYDLFREFYRWEIAISVACALINVNAFDQPNVQDSKTRTVAKVNDFKKNGKLDELAVCWRGEGVEAYFNFENEAMKNAKTVKEFIAAYLKLAKSGEDYVAINAYIPRNDETLKTLQSFRTSILKATNCATTLGFGPRFQHSTGQLHKGGANNGVFIQLVADAPQDTEIPGEGMSFATFERAQALGDFEALLAVNRRAIRLNLGAAPLSILA